MTTQYDSRFKKINREQNKNKIGQTVVQKSSLIKGAFVLTAAICLGTAFFSNKKTQTNTVNLLRTNTIDSSQTTPLDTYLNKLFVSDPELSKLKTYVQNNNQEICVYAFTTNHKGHNTRKMNIDYDLDDINIFLNPEVISNSDVEALIESKSNDIKHASDKIKKRHDYVNQLLQQKGIQEKLSQIDSMYGATVSVNFMRFALAKAITNYSSIGFTQFSKPEFSIYINSKLPEKMYFPIIKEQLDKYVQKAYDKARK